MYQETFKPNPIRSIVTLILLLIGFVFFYYFMIVDPLFTLPFSSWFLLLLFVPLILPLIGGQMTRLSIDGETLRYERGIFPRQEDKVSLLEVAEFTAKSDWGENQNTHTRVIHIINKKGDLIFVIPGTLIGFRNIERFKSAVLAVNPKIKID